MFAYLNPLEPEFQENSASIFNS